jgi:hypothetical protein
MCIRQVRGCHGVLFEACFCVKEAVTHVELRFFEIVQRCRLCTRLCSASALCHKQQFSCNFVFDVHSLHAAMLACCFFGLKGSRDMCTAAKKWTA